MRPTNPTMITYIKGIPPWLCLAARLKSSYAWQDSTNQYISKRTKGY